MEPVLFTLLFALIAVAFVVSLVKPDYRSQKELRDPLSIVNLMSYAFVVIMILIAGNYALTELKDEPVLKYVALALLFLIIFGSLPIYFFLVRKKNWSADKLFEKYWTMHIIYLLATAIERIFGKRK